LSRIVTLQEALKFFRFSSGSLGVSRPFMQTLRFTLLSTAVLTILRTFTRRDRWMFPRPRPTPRALGLGMVFRTWPRECPLAGPSPQSPARYNLGRFDGRSA